MTIGKEVNLLERYPQSNRDIKERSKKTEFERLVARRFDKDFFDGDRKYGYGGYSYNPRFWQFVVKDFIKYWGIENNSSVLDIGCGKGFMLYDFVNELPKLKIEGIDISTYAIKNCKKEVRNYLNVGNAKKLKYKNNSFDYVISINTIHNLEINECIDALKEIERVKKKKSFVMVDAFRNAEEKEKILNWNLTAKTILSVDDWKKLFKEIKYTGDYYWFIP
jgi:ubiquinone/menaquinone biosynthesis C-methylase UbiE